MTTATSPLRRPARPQPRRAAAISGCSRATVAALALIGAVQLGACAKSAPTTAAPEPAPAFGDGVAIAPAAGDPGDDLAPATSEGLLAEEEEAADKDEAIAALEAAPAPVGTTLDGQGISLAGTTSAERSDSSEVATGRARAKASSPARDRRESKRAAARTRSAAGEAQGGVVGGVTGGVLGGVAAHSPAQGYGAPLAPTEPGAPLVAPPHDPAAVGPTTTGDAYAYVPEQSFTAVAADPRSTFSIDVDTASYANVRKFLASGQLPPVDAVRIEELLNYFDYDYVSPPAGSPFAVSAEVGPCPWNANNRIVHVGIKGMELAQQQVPARNLVFLIDVSGSMGDADKLPLLKRSMAQLVEGMRAEDHVSMVVYAGASGVVLPPTSGQDKRRILRALDQLESGGSTNGGAGIELAYRLARRNFQAGAVNRVILATDGDFNVGATSHGELVRMIERERESGVFLSVLGFGRGNLNDETMEQLADKGNGNYAYIDSDREAHKVLVQEASGTLVTIAKDVKIQVEWNPATVASYRLIGYDNRKLAHEDFNDDRKDAGEIGAGHTVTALYEVVPAGAPGAAPGVDPLKYQAPLGATPAAGSGELMTVKLRYKRPDGDRSQLIAFPVRDTDRDLARTSDSFRFSAAVVAFGLLLRDSQHRGAANWELVDGLARGALGRDPSGHRREFLELANLAARMKGDPAPLATSYPADAVVYAH